MGIVREAYQKGAPLSGGPPKSHWFVANFRELRQVHSWHEIQHTGPCRVRVRGSQHSWVPMNIEDLHPPKKYFSTRVETRDFYIAVHIFGTRKSEMG